MIGAGVEAVGAYAATLPQCRQCRQAGRQAGSAGRQCSAGGQCKHAQRAVLPPTRESPAGCSNSSSSTPSVTSIAAKRCSDIALLTCSQISSHSAPSNEPGPCWAVVWQAGRRQAS